MPSWPPTPVGAPPRGYAYPRVSPEVRQIAIDVRDERHGLWLWDLLPTALTADVSADGGSGVCRTRPPATRQRRFTDAPVRGRSLDRAGRANLRCLARWRAFPRDHGAASAVVEAARRPPAGVLSVRLRAFVPVVDYAPLVASSACFARAESRSSLDSDSFSPPRFC